MTHVNFNEIRMLQAIDAVAGNTFENQDSNDEFFDGNHWQRGSGFLDKAPPPSHIASGIVKSGLENMFTGENVIGQVVTRRADGVLSVPPKINAMSGDSVDDEVESAIKQWWSDMDLAGKFRRAVEKATLHDKVYFRLLIPEGHSDEAEAAETPIDALKHIYVDVVTRDKATIIEDPRTLGKCGIYVYNDISDEPRDPARRDRGSVFGTERFAEVCYVDIDDGRKTVLRLINDGDGIEDSTKMDLGGDITYFELCDLLLITDTVRNQQRALNTGRTHMMLHNRSTDWQQRIFFNAQPPGSVIKDEVTGEEIHVDSDTFERAPGADLYLAGMTEDTADGERLKDPSMTVIEPGSVQRFIDSERTNRLGILRDCRQLHVELSDDATSTGEARQQAMEDFVNDLGRVKKAIDNAAHWMLRTVWAMAKDLSRSPGDDIRFKVEFIISVGHVDNDRRRVSLEEVRDQVVSRRTAIAERGVEDPETEIRLIDNDPVQQLTRRLKMAEALKVLVDAGSSLRGAAEYLGFEDKDIKSMEEIDLPPVAEPQNIPEPISPEDPEPEIVVTGDGA